MAEYLTKEEFVRYMAELEQRLEQKLTGKRPTTTLTRKEVIEDIGRVAYYDGVRKGYINPIQRGARNSKIRIEKREFESWKQQLKK